MISLDSHSHGENGVVLATATAGVDAELACWFTNNYKKHWIQLCKLANASRYTVASLQSNEVDVQS